MQIPSDKEIKQILELEAEFNRFIKKWCGDYYAHLIDTDENDGQFFREKLERAVNLATAYLEASGEMPAKKDEGQNLYVIDRYVNRSFNLAIDDCTLAHLKKVQELQDKHEDQIRTVYDILEQKNQEIEKQKTYIAEKELEITNLKLERTVDVLYSPEANKLINAYEQEIEKLLKQISELQPSKPE